MSRRHYETLSDRLRRRAEEAERGGAAGLIGRTGATVLAAVLIAATFAAAFWLGLAMLARTAP
ncbi:MAG: hypothetical protein WCJ64_23905 [Rhodospirillaceae bacterium]